MSKLDDEALYRLLAHQIETIPDLRTVPSRSTEARSWIGKTCALIEAQGVLTDQVALDAALMGLGGPHHDYNVERLLQVLHRALARAELRAPASAQGAFIAAGKELDAYGVINKVLSTATNDVFIVDPYMDASVITDFCPLVPDNVAIGLLTDEATMKASLEPAYQKYAKQNGNGRLAVRVTPPKALHDRLIIIDGKAAWILTQSLKDFAVRAPASVARAPDETASLKVGFYADLWKASRSL